MYEPNISCSTTADRAGWSRTTAHRARRRIARHLDRASRPEDRLAVGDDRGRRRRGAVARDDARTALIKSSN